jgi:prolyl oligopeptidase
MTSSTINQEVEEEDTYIYLEDIESEESMEFAKSANAKCLSSLGDPKLSIDGTYTRILAALNSDERIPYVSVLGYDDTTTTDNDENGEMLLYNFWKDSKVSYI